MITLTLTLIYAIIATCLKSRYVSSTEDMWIFPVLYYICCLLFTPIIGIPLYKFITCSFKGGPYSRIFNPDGSYA